MRGIYRITCSINGKQYVGKGDIKARISKHKRTLHNGNHDNKYLQADWDAYGESAFVFETIERYDVISESDLDERERHYIELFGSFTDGYNQTLGGTGSYGYKHSDEVRRGISERVTARGQGGERNPFYGKKHTDETRQKISDANRGRLKGVPKSEEHRRRLAASNAMRAPVLINGFVYASMTEASREIGVDRKTISYRVNSDNFPNYSLAHRGTPNDHRNHG